MIATSKTSSCNYCSDDEDTKVGRPRITVGKNEILSLRGLHFSWVKIARMLGISRRTLY